MLTIYVVRHGEAEGNAGNKLMGQCDCQLTERGRKDAEKVGEKLKSVRFDKIFSSDLKRAHETANIICKKLDHPFGPGMTEKLREIDVGDCCGMDAGWLFMEYPESRNSADFCFPNGESYRELFQRISDFMKSMEKKHNGKTVLIVAHEGVIKAIEYYFGCIEFSDHSTKNYSHDYIGKFIID